jgi:hypothetical protein
MRDFSRMAKDELEEYLNFLLTQYRVVDALWFLSVEDRFGLDKAVELNEEIWSSIGSRIAGEIKTRFNVKGKGVPAVVKALSYFPWAMITKYEIEQTESKAIIKVPKCTPQDARLRHGRREFPCKTMHFKLFQNFAKAIDERVKVRCIMAPPDTHPKNLWCKWELICE